ncbi:hypothetical protein [Saccharothrix syringae]|uniref:WXG100 family type VII secretion target n=1 Tax=Saccharothrix syringae TaxID=103733 RepID=A0A5Q0HAW3_SACSY|nr:hypothetical protein [Saccharothrix syringae]QFZ23319.1 hypothetical protein EKG83_43050 [Saccharothrix syringae]
MPETPIDAPPGIELTEENKLKGTLFISAWDEMISSIGKDAETETEKALDITFATIGAVSSTVMLAVDPFGTLLGAGIGWLLEHVSFLREPLDQLMGDPDEINANVEAHKKQAAELRVLAEDHRKGLVDFDGWSGQSADAFKASMEALGQELDTLANGVEQKAKIVAICGVLVQVLRDIVRDMIAQFLGSLLAAGIAAAAAAIFTFGASIAAFITYAVAKGTALAVNIGSRIARLLGSLGRQAGRIKNLDEITENLGKNWNRFENIADVAEVTYESWKAGKGVDREIDKALGEDAKNDAERARVEKEYEKVEEANEKYEEANEKYEAAKDKETKESEDVSKAYDQLNTAADKVAAANGRANAAVEEANAAAARGDQAGYDAAMAKYDAAKAEGESARAEAAKAAENAARESRELADAAKESKAALDATKPLDDAASAAYDEFKRNNPGGEDDPARTAAENDLTTKGDAAKDANARYEQANLDLANANAAAAEANAKAFASGSEADSKAAEEAQRRAQEATLKAQQAAAEAKSAGEAAKSSYDSYQSQYAQQ